MRKVDDRKRKKKRKWNEKNACFSGHYVIASSLPPERLRPNDDRWNAARSCQKNAVFSGHYVIASIRPPEQRPLERRTLVPISMKFVFALSVCSNQWRMLCWCWPNHWIFLSILLLSNPLQFQQHFYVVYERKQLRVSEWKYQHQYCDCGLGTFYIKSVGGG